MRTCLWNCFTRTAIKWLLFASNRQKVIYFWILFFHNSKEEKKTVWNKTRGGF